MKLLAYILILTVLIQPLLANPCPYGWKDEGEDGGTQICEMPGTYGRGGGFTWTASDGLKLDGAKKRCEEANKDLGCEQWGLIYYPKCKEGFVNRACCICAPKCPDGWDQDDIAWTCEKDK